ncbi:hypothetical protein C8P66_103119 [Humitalea rosea]|uniref:Methyl-accepting chemotaxis protein n=1 Tax=Humitalea rosea TaxID=990373 RepID=A0A2W7ITA3_9PROT|nr:hypothetical protein [Humitalea rosea]PZW49093.1 hypothetical protein C8P66_103119 [Humitalea rosea]
MRQTLSLAGLVMLLMLASAGVGLFALDRSRDDHLQAVHGLAALTEQRDNARQIEVAFKVQVQEWKNILLRGYDPALRARYQAAFAERRADVAVGLAALAGTPEAGRLAAAHAVLGQAYDAALASADLTTAEGVRAADAAVRGADREVQEQLDGLAEALGEAHRDAAMAMEERLTDRYEETRHLLLVVTLAGLLATLILLGLLARRRR